jgi:rod shape-determining protein MreD
MTAQRLPYTSIDKPPTRTRLMGIPVATVMLGSLMTMLPVIASMPWLPPFGYLTLIAWRLLQRNMWPVWIGLPLGLFDDMVSGQPLGSAIFLWTLTFLMLDVLDRRMVWRDVWAEWGVASACTVLLLMSQLWIANGGAVHTSASVLVPQMFVSIFAFPVVARLCEWLDQLRRST